MTKLVTYLNFDGQCEAAFKLYEKCFRGKITFTMKYGDSPMAGDTPPEAHGRTMHTTLDLGDQLLQGADVFPGRYQKPQGFSIAVTPTDPAEADRIFACLAENGKVEMPLQETFWALRFGTVTDQFGTPWSINCEKPAQ